MSVRTADHPRVGCKKMSKITYEPYGDNVQLELSGDAEKVGAIIMPQRRQLPAWCEAVVVAAGPKCVLVKVGDLVLINSGAVLKGQTTDLGVFAFTKEDKILAVVRGRVAGPMGEGRVEGPVGNVGPQGDPGVFTEPIPFPQSGSERGAPLNP